MRNQLGYDEKLRNVRVSRNVLNFNNTFIRTERYLREVKYFKTEYGMWKVISLFSFSVFWTFVVSVFSPVLPEYKM